LVDDDLCAVVLWLVDLCVEDVFAVVFFVLAWLVAFAGFFELASFDCCARSSCACFSTAAALAGSVLVVMPPLVPCAYAPAVARDIRRIKLSLFTVRLIGC
jgi:hypothetical protein